MRLRVLGLTLIPLVLSVAVAQTRALDQTPSAAAAGNWPQWRGPNRDGVSTEKGLLQTWPADGPRKLFTATGMGGGFSSVAVTGGRIYTMGDRRDGQYALAFNEADGKPMWATRVGEVHQDEYGGPRGTPTVDGDLVFVLASEGTIVALEAATGRHLWSKSLTRDYRAPTPGWLFAESPLVDGPNVLISPGSSRAAIVALEKTTGKEVWRSLPTGGGSGGPEYSSIVISNGGGVKQYVRLAGQGVIGVRASDGQFLWSYGRVANGTANIPTPVISGNFVFASSGYQTGAALLELTPAPDNRVTAAEKYFLEGRTFQNHHGGMVLLGNYIYAGHGHNSGFPMCIELLTGKVVWGGNFRNDGSGSAAVTAADGHLYFRYQNGVMMLIEATPTAYREKGKFQIPGVRNPSWSHPVVTGGRLYLREQDALHVYDVRR
ncbi:MAG TPA: PQQ-binding-like beta-propeller repeat protein [Vicinamibacterales bacterium]|nr:PQQ-binding-like beta-propeller repeat protein [Vicinamibacterales bacterium]